MMDEKLKRRFREEGCNIVEMSKGKIANIPKGTKILQSLQSDDEFEKLLSVKNWAVTQTIQSNVLFFDLDSNEYDKNLDKFFNRRRDKYIKNSEQINSKHGFIKVTDADYQWCVEFAKRYHRTSGIEIYAENHWVIFSGIYYNEKNTEEPKRETTWYPIDDLHNDPVMEFTKDDLGLVFSKISDIKSGGQILAGEGLRHTALIGLGFKEAKLLIKKREILNSSSLYQKLINSEMIDGMKEYEKGNGKYQELESIIEFVIDHVESDISFAQDYLQSKNENRFAHILDNPLQDQFNAWCWNGKKWNENTAHFILEKMLPLQSEEFKPNSGMALKISNNISASDLTLKVDLTDIDYVKNMMGIMTNIFGEYYDFKTGVIKNVDPSIMFYKNPQLKIQFDGEIDEPLKFFEFVKERLMKIEVRVLYVLINIFFMNGNRQ